MISAHRSDFGPTHNHQLDFCERKQIVSVLFGVPYEIAGVYNTLPSKAGLSSEYFKGLCNAVKQLERCSQKQINAKPRITTQATRPKKGRFSQIDLGSGFGSAKAEISLSNLTLFSSQKTKIFASSRGTNMAKRFTDTNKWAKPSFGELSSDMKLVWIYICDACDHAGIWDLNLRLLQFHISPDITLDHIKESFGEKLVFLSPTKVFIPAFIDFQYGALNPENRAHKSVIDRLEKEGASKALTSSINGAKDKDKDKEQDKVKVKEKEKDKEKRLHFLAESWNQLISSLPKVTSVGAARMAKINLRVKERPYLEEWEVIFKNIEESEFLSGRSGVWTVCSFDWIIENESNHVKVFEGNYKNKAGKMAPTRQQQASSNNAILMQKINAGEFDAK